MSQIQNLALRSAADVVDVLPLLVGYYPAERMAVVAFDAQDRLMVTGTVELTDDVAILADALLPIAHRAGSVMLLVYTEDVEHAWHVLNTVTSIMDIAADVAPIRATIAVTPEGWTEYEDEPLQPVPHGPAETAAIVAGLTCQPSRDEVTRTLAPNPARVTERQALTPTGFPEDARSIRNELDDTTPETMTAETAQRLASLTLNTDHRDAYLFALTPERAERDLFVWCAVATYYDDTEDRPEAEGALMGLTMTGWLSGRGAHMTAALQRTANREDAGVHTGPNSSLMLLMDKAHRLAVPPSAWAEIAKAMQEPDGE